MGEPSTACLRACLPPQEAAQQLAEAAQKLPRGSCIGCLHIFAAVKEGLYVSVSKRLMFQYRGVPIPLADSGAVSSRCVPQSLIHVTRSQP